MKYVGSEELVETFGTDDAKWCELFGRPLVEGFGAFAAVAIKELGEVRIDEFGQADDESCEAMNVEVVKMVSNAWTRGLLLDSQRWYVYGFAAERDDSGDIVRIVERPTWI